LVARTSGLFIDLTGVRGGDLLVASGYLGGHLSYVQGVGVGTREPGRSPS
jgi:hypothetical protein